MSYESMAPDEQDFWRKDAACYWVSQDSPGMESAWLEEEGEAFNFARMICEDCPVRRACLMDAVRDPASEGLRGGYFFTAGGVRGGDLHRIREEFGVRARVRNKTPTAKQRHVSAYERAADVPTDMP